LGGAFELLALGPGPPGGDVLWTRNPGLPRLLFALTLSRVLLYGGLEARVAALVALGAADEVCRAHAAGASPSARQALGFDELLRGDVGAMQQRTRRYAKRQLTWLRKLPGARRIDLTERTPDVAAAAILAMIP
jgi:tRNA dimethylallyltransferase